MAPSPEGESGSEKMVPLCTFLIFISDPPSALEEGGCGLGLLVVLRIVRDLPNLAILLRSDHPELFEGPTLRHIDARLEQEGGFVALGAGFLQRVVDYGLARRLIDVLALGELHFVVNFVEGESRRQLLHLLLVDEDVARLDETIDHATRAIAARASRHHRHQDDECEESSAELPPLHHRFLNSSSSFACAADFDEAPAPAPLPAPGAKYSQKLKRSLSTTRSA